MAMVCYYPLFINPSLVIDSPLVTYFTNVPDASLVADPTMVTDLSS